MYKSLALLAGFLISIMVALNGSLAGYTGFYFSVFIIHVVGFLSINLILLFRKEQKISKQNIPIYLFLGGGIGVFVTLFNVICFKYLGMSLTISLGLLGQSIFSCFIDHFGLFGVNVHKFYKSKIIGFLFILSGIAVMTFY